MSDYTQTLDFLLLLCETQSSAKYIFEGVSAELTIIFSAKCIFKALSADLINIFSAKSVLNKVSADLMVKLVLYELKSGVG